MGKVTALGMDTIHEGSGHQMTGMAVSVCLNFSYEQRIDEGKRPIVLRDGDTLGSTRCCAGGGMLARPTALRRDPLCSF